MTAPTRLVRATSAGRLELELADEGCTAEIVALALAAASVERQSFGRRIEFGGRAAYLKGGPLRGGASVRHALREQVLREAPARFNEARNLRWLGARGLPTVDPLAAGLLRRGGVVRFQFLVTGWLDGARPLDAFWSAADSAARQDVVTHLARDVGRMHGLGFVHRDLFFRNLVVPAGEESRAHLIDCWRGGPGHRWRGAAYDLACLMLDAVDAWGDADQQHFFIAYVEERRLHAQGVDPRALLERARREHVRLVQRLGRRGRATSARAWQPPPLPLPRSGERSWGSGEP